MTVFVDSSFLIAFFNKDDEFHKRSVRIVENLEKKESVFLTSNIAIAESINVIFRLYGTKMAKRFSTFINTSNIEVFSLTESLFSSSLTLLLKQRSKKGLNFFDCMHIATMNHLGISTILTFDTDFNKANIEV